MDGPAYLPVGTEVSAKYRGAFCEAKVKKIVRAIKIKVSLIESGLPLVVTDDDVKGPLKIGCNVEVKHPESGQFVEAKIYKITDQSMYTVVFDDGDENTLRRTQLCLKGEKHFVKTDTLDELPLTHPEHFGTPVVKGSKKKRRSAQMSSDSESEESSDDAPRRRYWGKLQSLIGKLFCMQQDDRKKSMIVPVLVVHPNADDAELKTRDHLFVKSFKDSKIYLVLKKELKDFTRETAMKNDDKALKSVYEKALLYFDAKELPQNWDKEEVLGSESDDDEEDDPSSDDEQSEEKDMFVAQLYKFMDDRGTPINKAPVVGTRDLNLYRLFRVVQKLGGYNRVTNQMKWRLVYSKMLLPNSATAANQIKTAYKKYLHAFEDFYRKLGSSMGTITRPSRSRHSSSRNIVGFRDRGDRGESSPRSPRTSAAVSVAAAKKAKDDNLDDSLEQMKPADSKVLKDKSSPDDIKGEPSDNDSPSKRKTRTSLEDKSTSGKLVKDKKPSLKEEIEALNKEDSKLKKRPVRKKLEKHAVIKLEEIGDIKKAMTASSHRDVTKEADEDDESDDDYDAKSNKTTASEESSTKKYETAEYPPGSKLKVKYGKGKNQTTFEAKVLDCEIDGGNMHYLVHYNGWNVRYDEWVKKDRIVDCVYKSDGRRAIPSAKPTLPGSKLPVIKKKMVVAKGAKTEAFQKQDKEEKSVKNSTSTTSSIKTVIKDSKPPRPTRSTSLETNLSVGLAKKKRARRNSGYSETSKSRLSDDGSTDSEKEGDEDADIDDNEEEMVAEEQLLSCPPQLGETSNVSHVYSTGPNEKPLSQSGTGLDTRESAFDFIKELQASASEMEFDKASQESLERDLNIKVPERGKMAKNDSDEDMDINVLFSYFKDDEYKFPSSESESVKSEGPEKRRGKTKTKGELKAKPDLSKLAKSETVKPKVDTPSKTKQESSIKTKADITKNKTEMSKSKTEITKAKSPELPRAKVELSRAKIEIPKVKAENVQGKGESAKAKVDNAKGKPDKLLAKSKPEPIKSRTETTAVKTKAEMKMVVTSETYSSEKEEPAESQDVKISPKEKDCEKSKAEKSLSSGDEQTTVDKPSRRPRKEQKDNDTEKDDKIEKSLDTPSKTRGRGRGKRKLVEKEAEDSEDEPWKKKTRKKIKKTTKDEEDKLGVSKFSSPSGDDLSKDEEGQSSQESGCWVSAPELTATPKFELQDLTKGDDDVPDEPAPPLSPVQQITGVVVNQPDPYYSQEKPLDNPSAVQDEIQDALDEEEDDYVKPIISAVVDNTPPQTPENISANQTPHHEIIYEACSTRSEMEANFEVEKFLQGARPPGEDSPSVYDPSNVSTASDESLNLEKGVDAVNDFSASVSCSAVKRKSQPEDNTQPVIIKRRRSKKGNKSKLEQKRGLSDFEDEDSKDGIPGTSKQVQASTSSTANYPALSKEFPMGPPKYDFIQQLEEAKYLEREQRVNFLFGKISDLRNVYMRLKAEVASIDRKRKRYRKKQRLAQEAAAQCLIGLEQSVS